MGRITSAVETGTYSTSALSATLTLLANTQAIYWSNNTSQTTNFTVNLTATSGMNTALANVGDSTSFEVIVTNGATAYYNTVVQVEGTTSGVTTNWQGGTAPTAGNINSKDVYTYQVFKTAASTYLVFASQTKFA
jgi:hypothetical protein